MVGRMLKALLAHVDADRVQRHDGLDERAGHRRLVGDALGDALGAALGDALGAALGDSLGGAGQSTVRTNSPCAPFQPPTWIK